jgi:hypothetical protein
VEGTSACLLDPKQVAGQLALLGVQRLLRRAVES